MELLQDAFETKSNTAIALYTPDPLSGLYVDNDHGDNIDKHDLHFHTVPHIEVSE